MPSPDAVRLRRNLDVVWATVTGDLPPLLPLLDSALAEIEHRTATDSGCCHFRSSLELK